MCGVYTTPFRMVYDLQLAHANQENYRFNL